MPCFRRQQHRARSLLTFFVMVSLITFVFAIYFYAHLHVLPDGRIVVHSHAMPKGGSANRSHTHTALELLVLDQLSTIKTLVVAALILFLLSLFATSLFPSYTPLAAQASYTLFSRRGPPITF